MVQPSWRTAAPRTHHVRTVRMPAASDGGGPSKDTLATAAEVEDGLGTRCYRQAIVILVQENNLLALVVFCREAVLVRARPHLAHRRPSQGMAATAGHRPSWTPRCTSAVGNGCMRPQQLEKRQAEFS